MVNELPKLGRSTGLLRHVGREDQLVNAIRMSNRELERVARSVAETKDIRLLDMQVPEKSVHIVRRALVRDRSFAVACAAVALLLQGDHLPSPGQEGKNPAPCDINRRAASMKQNERN